jgi:hypothetical protein
MSTPESTKIYELHPSSLENAQVKKLLQSLKHWLNSFNSRGVAVSDIFNDLGVAFIIATLIEKTTGDQIIEIDAFARATAKNYALLMGIVVQYCEKELGTHQNVERWTLQGILDRNIVSLLCFLVELATYTLTEPDCSDASLKSRMMFRLLLRAKRYSVLTRTLMASSKSRLQCTRLRTKWH